MKTLRNVPPNERLGLFAASASECAIVLIDVDGRIVEWSSGAQHLLGWTPGEALDQPLAMIFTPEDRAAGAPEIELAAARRNGHAAGNRWNVKKNGSRLFVDAITHAIRDDNGVVIGFGKVLRDLTAHKLAQDAAYEHASMLDLAYDAVFTWTFDSGVIRYWNASATELYGYAREEALGQSAHALLATVFPQDLPAAQDTLQRIGRWEGELTHTTRDGRQIKVQSRMVLRTDLGDSPQVLETNRDITRQKQAEQALRESEERFRSLVLATSHIVWRADPDGRLIEDSRSWRSFTGQSYEQMRDFGWLDAVHPEDRARTTRVWNDAVARRGVYEIELRMRCADGDYRWSAVRAVPLLNSDGTIREWMGANSDVTDIHGATEQLRASEERVRLATDAAELGIWSWEGATDRGFWDNDRMYTIFGFERTDEPLNLKRALADVFHPDDTGRLSQAMAAAFNDGQRLHFEGRFYRPDQELRWLELKGHLQRGPDAAPLRLIGTAADITERKRTEEDLRRLAAELSEASRRKTEFLAVLAHELRNPLAPIRTGLELIRLSDNSPATVAHVSDIMERQLTHMVRLVDDLLDVARISSGKVELKKQRMPLESIVTSATEASLPFIEKARQELVIDLPTEPMVLDADPTRFAQVLVNLLTNASKYTPPGGKISVRAQRQGAEVWVAVSDTGIGIPREALPSIFDMFIQVKRDPAYAKGALGYTKGGLGIGLAIVRRLVELHGGTIQAASDGPGKGSTFTIRLPLPAAGVGDESPTGPDAAATPATPGCCVLIADDNADAARTLADLLTHEGHTTRVAHDGREALETARTFGPDVAVLDIGMPGMDGYEVARELRRMPQTRHATLIALTGWGDISDRARSHAAGFDHHLTKPAEFSVLQRLLATTRGRGSC